MDVRICDFTRNLYLRDFGFGNLVILLFRNFRVRESLNSGISKFATLSVSELEILLKSQNWEFCKNLELDVSRLRYVLIWNPAIEKLRNLQF